MKNIIQDTKAGSPLDVFVFMLSIISGIFVYFILPVVVENFLDGFYANVTLSEWGQGSLHKLLTLGDIIYAIPAFVIAALIFWLLRRQFQKYEFTVTTYDEW